jgi:hypothetical protein
MPGLSSRIREAQLTGTGTFLVLASAAIGLVWLSIWAVGAMTGAIAAAPLVVALGALAPLILFALVRVLRANEPEAQALAARRDDFEPIVRAAEAFVTKAPLTAIALAAVAGVLAARFPGALSLTMQLLSDRRS